MILGLNLNHDYSYCLFDGDYVYLKEMERFSRVRHHWTDESKTLAILDELPLSELKKVKAIYLNSPCMDQVEEKGGLLSSANREYIYTGDYLHENDHDNLAYGKLKVEGIEIDCAWVSHYHAHAASTYYASPFEQADILCLDGGGDFGYGGWFYGEHESLKVKRPYLDCQLGLSYHTLSKEVFGVKKGFYESKVMALAGFGEKIKSPHRFLKSDSSLDESFTTEPISVHDIAQFQDDFEQGVMKLIGKDKRHDYLCCAGGCFLNVSLNRKLAQSGLYKGIFIPAFAPDMGTAVGCAMFACLDHGIKMPKLESLQSPYLGTELRVTAQGIQNIIEKKGDPWTSLIPSD